MKNLPKKNVQVVDSNMRLLSEGLADDKLSAANSSVSKQLEEKNKVDSALEKKFLAQLEPIYGSGRIKVNVNAVLDFDASNTQTVIVDKNPPLVSENTKKSSEGASSNTSNSPVDENMVNRSSDTTNNNTNTTEETTKNYNDQRSPCYLAERGHSNVSTLVGHFW